MLNYADFGCIDKFTILPFNEFSDHAPLNLKFYCKIAEDDSIVQEENKEPKIVWDNDKAHLIQQCLHDQNEFFQHFTENFDNMNIDEATTLLTEFLKDKLVQFMGKQQKSSKRKPKNSQPWFDMDCREARKTFTKS